MSIEDSAVDLVEEIQEDEDVEADGIKCKSIGGYPDTITIGVSYSSPLFSGDEVERLSEEDECTEVHQREHGNDLEHGLNDNLSPVLLQDNNFSLRSGNSCELGSLLVLFCSESDSTKDVHDQVAPKHLNDVERVLANCGSSDDRNGANDNVDSKLELHELPHVVENGLAPLHGSVNGLELVVPDHEIGGVLGHIAARSHAETDLSAL